MTKVATVSLLLLRPLSTVLTHPNAVPTVSRHSAYEEGEYYSCSPHLSQHVGSSRCFLSITALGTRRKSSL